MKKLIVIAALVFAAMMTARAQYSDSWVTGKTTRAGIECQPFLFAQVPPRAKGATRDDIFFGSANVPPNERVYSPCVGMEDDPTGQGRWGYRLANGTTVWVTWEYRDGRPWQAAKVECNDITITRSW